MLIVLCILWGLFLIDRVFSPRLDVNYETKDLLLYYTFKNKRRWVVIWKKWSI